VENRHYSSARAKTSLIFFGLGKVISASLSIFFLGLTVRYMDVSDYGRYIVVLAMVEIFYLTTGFGLSTVAQRYVPEARIQASNKSLRNFLHMLVARRLIYSIACALLLCAVAHFMGDAIPSEFGPRYIYWIALLITLAASSSFLDEVAGSLLMQGLSQGLTVGRMVVKLAAAFYLVLVQGSISFMDILLLETGATLISVICGHVVLARGLRHDSDGTASSLPYTNTSMWPVAGRFYLVQLVGQAYGPNVTRLVIGRILGLAQTALFGFAQGIADMLRNLLPAHLLAGWIRPLMVSRYLTSRDVNDLADAANLVLKLNLMGVVPLTVFFLFRGDAFASWASAGKYGQAGLLLALLTIMIGLQTIHLLFSIITITLEQARASLVATLLAAATLPVQVALIAHFGATGACWGLLASEAVWLTCATYLLAKNKINLTWDIKGSTKILFSGVLAGLCVWMLGFGEPNLLDLAVSSLVVGSVFLVCSIVLKPLRNPERELIKGIVPARFILW
jgi:O-antigen/teichoic acid export membrane protein